MTGAVHATPADPAGSKCLPSCPNLDHWEVFRLRSGGKKVSPCLLRRVHGQGLPGDMIAERRGCSMLKIRTTIVACLLAASLATALAEVSSEVAARLERYGKTYETELAKIDSEASGRIDTLNGQYLRSLGTLESSLQKAGRLEPLLAVKRERERFAAESSVGDSDLSEAVQELREVQDAFVAAAGNTELRQARATNELARKLDRTLEALTADLTRNGAFEDAVAVKTFREKTARRAEVTAADFVIAEAEAQAGPEAAPTPVPGAEPEPAEDGMTVELACKLISKRYDEWCNRLSEGDVIGALASCVDPRFTEKFGAEILKPYFDPAVEKLQEAKKAGMHFDVGSIEVDLEAKTAVSLPRIRIGDQWHDQEDKVQWVCVDGDWYIDFNDGKTKKQDKKERRAAEAEETRRLHAAE